MKYKVGDKVRVRDGLVVHNTYGKYVLVSSMEPYMGKIMTISCVRDDSYYFEEDKNKWCWTDEMLEGIEDINILVDGNKVIARKGDKIGIARCSPEDEFDIFIGARLAIDRLEEKCKPYSWLKKGIVYYYPAPTKINLFDHNTYIDDDIDKRLINRGLVFKTKEEAIEVAKKMLEVVK